MIFFLFLISFVVASSYDGIATCKQCSSIQSCQNNNCIYLTGGPYSNK